MAVTLVTVLVIPGLRPSKAKFPVSDPLNFAHFCKLLPNRHPSSTSQPQDPFSMHTTCSKLLLHAGLPCELGLAKASVVGRL